MRRRSTNVLAVLWAASVMLVPTGAYAWFNIGGSPAGEIIPGFAVLPGIGGTDANTMKAPYQCVLAVNPLTGYPAVAYLKEVGGTDFYSEDGCPEENQHVQVMYTEYDGFAWSTPYCVADRESECTGESGDPDHYISRARAYSIDMEFNPVSNEPAIVFTYTRTLEDYVWYGEIACEFAKCNGSANSWSIVDQRSRNTYAFFNTSHCDWYPECTAEGDDEAIAAVPNVALQFRQTGANTADAVYAWTWPYHPQQVHEGGAEADLRCCRVQFTGNTPGAAVLGTFTVDGLSTEYDWKPDKMPDFVDLVASSTGIHLVYHDLSLYKVYWVTDPISSSSSQEIVDSINNIVSLKAVCPGKVTVNNTLYDQFWVCYALGSDGADGSFIEQANASDLSSWSEPFAEIRTCEQAYYDFHRKMVDFSYFTLPGTSTTVPIAVTKNDGQGDEGFFYWTGGGWVSEELWYEDGYSWTPCNQGASLDVYRDGMTGVEVPFVLGNEYLSSEGSSVLARGYSSVPTMSVFHTPVAPATTAFDVKETNSNQTMTIYVGLSHAYSETVEILPSLVAITGGATIGTDVTYSATPLTWQRGSVVPKAVNLTIVGDTTPEKDETFTFRCDDPGAGYPNLAQVDKTVKILDDDRTVTVKFLSPESLIGGIAGGTYPVYVSVISNVANYSIPQAFTVTVEKINDYVLPRSPLVTNMPPDKTVSFSANTVTPAYGSFNVDVRATDGNYEYDAKLQLKSVSPAGHEAQIATVTADKQHLIRVCPGMTVLPW